MHFTPERARHGFEETLLPADYYDWIRQTGSLMQPMRHGLGQNELYPSTATVPEAATLTSWIAEQCVSYIRDRRDPTIIFTSDHGEFLGDFGTSRKTALRDPTARIPLLLRHPASA